MNSIKLASIGLVAALAAVLPAVPAHAARARVFVASYGSDSNPCTFTQPCRNFQQAINTVAVGGEVTAIDSAGFGPINISHSVTITSPAGVEAGIVTTAGNSAITISAASTDTVILRGLTLDGAASAADGINFSSGGRLEVIDCAIRYFTTAGIAVQSATATSVLISNTVVSDMSGNAIGIYLITNTAGARITAALDNVTLSNNYIGVFADALSATLQVLISNSHIDNSLQTGVSLTGSNSALLSVMTMKNVTLNETPTAIAIGANGTVYLSQVTQTHAAGFSSSIGVGFSGADNNAFSDSTSHFQGSISGGVFQSWGLQ